MVKVLLLIFAFCLRSIVPKKKKSQTNLKNYKAFKINKWIWLKMLKIVDLFEKEYTLNVNTKTRNNQNQNQNNTLRC